MKVGDLVRVKGASDLALVLNKEKHHITLLWCDDGFLDRQPKDFMELWEVMSRESR